MKDTPTASFSSHLAALALCAVAWLMFLDLSGTLSSGFHLTDDHQKITLNEELAQNEGNVITVFREFMESDIKIRFRPVYVLYHVCQTAIFHTNFSALSWYHAGLAIFTSFLLYLFCRTIGFSWGQSLLFPTLTLLGSQAAIWYRLGNLETLGMPMAAVTLYFMGLSIFARSGRGLWGVLFILFAALMSLSKENFVLILPALGLMKVWLYRDNEECSWTRAVMKNLASLVALALITTTILYIIFYYVGADQTGYAGWDSGRVNSLLSQSLESLRRSEFHAAAITFYALLKPFLLVGWQLLRKSEIWIAIIAIYSLWICRSHDEGRLSFFRLLRIKGLLPVILVSGLIIVPQILLYAKSGIDERYRVPGVMGISFLAVWAYREAVNQAPQLRKILVTLFVLYLAVIGTSTYKQARGWGARGVTTNYFINEIKNSTEPDSQIVIVSDPVHEYEWTTSLRTYLTLESKRSNIYLHHLESPPYTPLEERYLRYSREDQWYQSHGSEQIDGAGAVACVAIFPKREKKFIAAPPEWFELARYNRILMPFPRDDSEEGFVIYYKKQDAAGNDNEQNEIIDNAEPGKELTNQD